MDPRLLLWMVATSLSCEATPARDMAPPRLAPQPEPVASRDAAATPTESAAEAASSEAPSAALPSAEPSRMPLPIVAASPGKIDCETVECDAKTELCCELYAGPARKCVSKSDPAGCATVEAMWKACDEFADCSDGEVCCYVARPDPSVAALQVCRKGSCNPAEPEVCLPGGKCRGKRRCKATAPGQRFSFCH